MSSYASVTFSEVMDDPLWRSDWSQEANITRRHIPYSNTDDVQAAGRGNLRISVKVTGTSSSDLGNLRAAVGTILRTLVLFGTTYGNTLLTSVSNSQLADTVDGTVRWTAELEFERQGT